MRYTNPHLLYFTLLYYGVPAILFGLWIRRTFCYASRVSSSRSRCRIRHATTQWRCTTAPTPSRRWSGRIAARNYPATYLPPPTISSSSSSPTRPTAPPDSGLSTRPNTELAPSTVMPMIHLPEIVAKNRYHKTDTGFWRDWHAIWYRLFLVSVFGNE